ncbi:hypothetical protein RclHR1_02000008 [Rhizophagus clarus]|uniref:Helix-loop-helix DNA-binding domain-containing transcription factor n=1 Tax=Rhizophagus clarus TaxID=94130 RepID=A0A2Z6QQQ4_9GLOM|nr:hypothetical protein RclHR1_02000008 [Rhizophagus clarus]GES99513.1 helix-loop-helix DNA-binding domain-containing transcription factor [Rhizophagus clarus]
MHHQQPFTSASTAFVFPETVVQTPVVINSDFTFTCPPPASVPAVPVSSVTFAPPTLPLSMNPTLSLNMYSIDNSQPSQVSQIISPSHSPSSPLSLLEYRDSPTADELDVPEFFQYSKEKYESAKSGCKRRRKSTRDEQCETSSMDGGDDIDDNVSCNHLILPCNQNSTMSQVEFRRQIHIQSEQKRRAEIKDGFEELRRQLPTTYTGRKLSKAVLLQKAVSHMKNMQRKESFLLDEINRLTQTCVYLNAELEKEKRMGTLYRQKQTLDKIYAIGL